MLGRSDNTALQQFGAAAPYLLTAPDGEGECLAWLTHLFGACGNKSMLSIIASPLTADELVRHMRPYLIAMTGQLQRDTRGVRARAF